MRVARSPKRLGGAHELVVGQGLVSQLDDVDASSQRGIEQRRGILAVRARLEDEIEPRLFES